MVRLRILTNLLQKWHFMLEEARELVAALPAGQVGTCVLASTMGTSTEET